MQEIKVNCLVCGEPMRAHDVYGSWIYQCDIDAGHCGQVCMNQDEATALAALQERLAELDQWQPFATAPTDGTTIIGWSDSEGSYPLLLVETPRRDCGVDTCGECDGGPGCGDGVKVWFTPCGEDMSDCLPKLWHSLPEPGGEHRKDGLT